MSCCEHCQIVRELADEIVNIFYAFVRVYTQVHEHDGGYEDLTCRELDLPDDLVDLEIEALAEPLQ